MVPRQNYGNYSLKFTLAIFINLVILMFLNILTLGIVLPRLTYWCLHSLVLRNTADGSLAPKHEALFKIYIQFVVLLFACVGKCH